MGQTDTRCLGMAETRKSSLPLRPPVEMVDMTTNEKVGSIQDPFACCDLTFNINDPIGDPALKATGGCCQWGLCCPLPCGPCSRVSFPITDAKTGSEVGHVEK